MRKADVIRGEPVSDSKISALAGRMECDEGIIRAIVELSNAVAEEHVGHGYAILKVA